jgi:peroxiredoxin
MAVTPSIASIVPEQEAPKLREGGSVPLFYLPAVGGGQSGPAALRSKYNMVLAFVEGSAEGESYLESLAAAYRDIQDDQAKVIAVISLPLDDAAKLAERLKLPYPLLADEGGATTRRMLGEANRAALCVADRYGQTFYVEYAPTSASLPSIQAALSWLDFIQIQCPE